MKFAIVTIFSIFITQSFHIAGKSLVTLRFLQNLRTSRSSSWTSLFISVEFCKICYFYHICYSIFSLSKKKSCYFCDFCEICYFFYNFLIVSFKCFLLKLRRQFDSKFLLTRSILNISALLGQLKVARLDFFERIPPKFEH